LKTYLAIIEESIYGVCYKLRKPCIKSLSLIASVIGFV
jgi:hypothetical protein